MHIVVIEDDPRIRDFLSRGLAAEGYQVEAFSEGQVALLHLVQCAREPDRQPVVILDRLLPDITGTDICRSLRTAGVAFPILMLTALDSIEDRVSGLESGADDYVVKPFKPQELVARIRARLRRGEDPEPERLTIGDLTIDVAGHAVRRGEESLSLTPLEFDLLLALARKPYQVFSREVLLEQVWGYRHAGDTRLVNVHVQRLRSKIEHDPENPQIVVTVRGVGYKAGPA